MDANVYKPARQLAAIRAALATAGMALAMCLTFLPSLMAQAPAANVREAWMNHPPTSTGLAIGEKIPPFQLRDQNGKLQDFNSIRGPQGAAIYFVRSADW